MTIFINNKSTKFCPITHTHPFNGPFSGTTRVGRYQKSKTNLDFTEARDSEWQWHQLGHMQVCTSLQTDNHANTSIHSFLQARCPSCSPKNSFNGQKEKCTNFCPITLHNKRFIHKRKVVLFFFLPHSTH